jgi:hypothetical protein
MPTNSFPRSSKDELMVSPQKETVASSGTGRGVAIKELWEARKVSFISFLTNWNGTEMSESSFSRRSSRVGIELFKLLSWSSNVVGIWILDSWAAEGTLNCGILMLEPIPGIFLTTLSADWIALFAELISLVIPEVIVVRVLLTKVVIWGLRQLSVESLNIVLTSATAAMTTASPPRTTNSRRHKKVERYMSMMNSMRASVAVRLEIDFKSVSYFQKNSI